MITNNYFSVISTILLPLFGTLLAVFIIRLLVPTLHLELHLFLGSSTISTLLEHPLKRTIVNINNIKINFFIIILNENREKKVLLTGKTIMADIKRACQHRDDFSAELFELE